MKQIFLTLSIILTESDLYKFIFIKYLISNMNTHNTMP